MRLVLSRYEVGLLHGAVLMVHQAVRTHRVVPANFWVVQRAVDRMVTSLDNCKEAEAVEYDYDEEECYGVKMMLLSIGQVLRACPDAFGRLKYPEQTLTELEGLLDDFKWADLAQVDGAAQA